jgi:serine/threonine protein phosphatase PrpC
MAGPGIFARTLVKTRASTVCENGSIQNSMNPFQENLQTWFSRKVPDRAQNQCFGLPLVLSSDIGLVRKENQDRAAAIYTGKKSINPLFTVAVSDGMGGMRDGGICATVAMSSFFYALIHHRNLNIRERAAEAIKYSNGEVFKNFHGNGGATLTAILLDSYGNFVIVHLGDTRIYTFSHGGKVERQTIDDSLAEAVGGTGRELLQFVGMGESMQARITEMSVTQRFCAITTDGIHSIEDKTLNRILENSLDIKQASERLAALSRWCGGHDNSTSAIFDIQSISDALAAYDENGIRLWDSFGDLTTLWLRDDDLASNQKQARHLENPNDVKGDEFNKQETAGTSSSEGRSKKQRPPAKRSRKKKIDEARHQNIELDIKIGTPDEQGGNGADS